MIKSIELYNFQNHKKLKVKFDPHGLNIIIGQTGAGKSAIFRALFLVSDNKPLGADKLFQSPKYKIIVRTETHTIIREPKSYTLIDSEDNEEVFKAFGSDVPAKVNQALNLKSANWQRQLSKHFLLFESPGAAAKLINNISGVSDQEQILNEIKSRILKVNTNFKYWSTVKEESNQTISRLKNIEEYFAFLQDLDLQNKRIMSKEIDIESLQRILVYLKTFDRKRNRIRSVTHFENLLKILEGKFSKLKELQNTISELEKIIVKLDKLSSIKDFSSLLNKTKEIEENFNEIKTREDRLQGLRKTLDFVIQNKQKMEKLYWTIQTTEQEFDIVLKNSGTCPLCNQRIK
jgi:DNA repair exonuclease SbcCD ATPase subunit